MHQVVKEPALLPGRAAFLCGQHGAWVTGYVNQTPAVDTVFSGRLINSTRPVSVTSQQE